MLVHLPDGHGAEAVRDGLITTMMTLPTHLRGSLTWDQGAEMAGHKGFSMATDMAVYFCDPASPWQRGTNENTNGLLNWSRKVGLGNRTLGDCGLLGAVFVGAEIVEPLLDSGGVPPVQVGS